MAGVKVKVTVDTRVLRRRLRRAAKPDMLLAWAEVGEIVLNSVQRNFDAEGRPKRWPRRKRQTRQTIGKKVLTVTGRLRNSIHSVPSARQVRVSSNVVYAATHNFGRDPIPQREFLLVQQEDEGPIAKALEEGILGDLSDG